MQICRKAPTLHHLGHTIQDSCGTDLKEALVVQAKHSAEFMISDACKYGRIGTEYKRVMDV